MDRYIRKERVHANANANGRLQRVLIQVFTVNCFHDF